MDVLGKAFEAYNQGADPNDVWQLLDSNPAQSQFGTPGPEPVMGDWVPNGSEFDGPSTSSKPQQGNPMDPNWLENLASLWSAPKAQTPPYVPPGQDQTRYAGGPGVEPAVRPGESLTPAQSGMSLWSDVTSDYEKPPEEEKWWHGLLGDDGTPSQAPELAALPDAVAAPALAAIPAQQQRRQRERVQYGVPPALRSLMGG